MSPVRALVATVLIACAAAGAPAQSGLAGLTCPRCGWKPPAALRTVTVRNIDELERAVDAARAGDAILLADGDYALRRMIDVHTPNVTIRSRSGDPAKVVLHGRGMTGDTVGVAISVSASGVTVADLTIREVGYHAVQVRGESGASGFTLHNARLLDTGQQLLKGSLSSNPIYADNGLVACSDFSYTVSAPSNYTNGVDLIGAKGWVIRDNRFSRIRGPASDGWKAGPTILAWGGSADTSVLRNTIVDSFRGIALGLAVGVASASRNIGAGLDHAGGVVRDNGIINLNAWADEGIEANANRDVRIEHNTVLVEGSLPWSISVRFPSALARVTDNLTSRQTQLRDGGLAAMEGNVTGATRSWFVDGAGGDLHLSAIGASRAGAAGIAEWRPIPR